MPNYYEKLINWFVTMAVASKHGGTFGANAEAFVRERFTDPILGKGTNPYHLCKEYVESKGLSTTFMPFLSRFGFYRSASLIFVVFSFALLSNFLENRSGLVATAALASLALGIIYFLRSRQFFAFQAPTVYAAFLVPYLDGILNNRTPSSDREPL